MAKDAEVPLLVQVLAASAGPHGLRIVSEDSPKGGDSRRTPPAMSARTDVRYRSPELPIWEG